MDDNPFGDPTPVAPKAAAPATPPPAAKAPTDPDAPLLPLITKIREIVKTTDDKFGGAQLRPLLMKSGIPVDQLKQVWALADVNKRGSLDLAELKLALRLIALAQDGRAIDPQAAAASRDLVPHFPSLDALAASAAAGGSAPATNNRTSVISSSSSPAGPAPSSSTSSLASPASPTTHRNSLEVLESFQELLDREHVTVTVAEKGTGMFSTTFYTVVSRAHGSTVTRRYSDFDWLHEVLLKRYPFRLIPEMPGKKLINKEDDAFVEQRRRGLVRFLEFAGRHPVLRNDETVITFLREENTDTFAAFKKHKSSQAIEEFTFNPIGLTSKEHTPTDADEALRIARDKLPALVMTLGKYIETVDAVVKRLQTDAADFMKMAQMQQLFIESEYPPTWVSSSSAPKQLLSRFEEYAKLHATLATGGMDSLVESLRHHLTVILAFQELLLRRQQTTQKEVVTYNRRVVASKQRLSQLAAAGKSGRALEIVQEEIDRDEREAQLIQKRDEFATFCLWKELQFFNHLKAYFSINVLELVRVRLQFAEGQVALLRQMKPLAADLPTSGFY